MIANWLLWFSAGLQISDLNENLESCCCAVWLAESGRSSVEMFCRVSSLGESCTLSSTQRSVNTSKNRQVTLFLYCAVWQPHKHKGFFLTSCPIVGSSTGGSITRAGPLNVPVLVQDVFSCLCLRAVSGQWVIWWTHRHTGCIEIKTTIIEIHMLKDVFSNVGSVIKPNQHRPCGIRSWEMSSFSCLSLFRKAAIGAAEERHDWWTDTTFTLTVWQADHESPAHSHFATSLVVFFHGLHWD